jgi:hypothetical protein
MTAKQVRSSLKHFRMPGVSENLTVASGISHTGRTEFGDQSNGGNVL